MRERVYRVVMMRNGAVVDDLKYTSLAWQTFLSASGWFRVNIPLRSIRSRYVQPNNVISIYRRGRHQITGFVEHIEKNFNNDGRGTLTVAGRDLNSLLDRRIVPYAPRETQSHKNNECGDIAKAIVRENLGSLADAERQISHLTVEEDKGDGPLVTFEMSFMNVEQAVQELMEISHDAGTKLYYNIAWVGNNNYQFRTYLNGIYNQSSRVLFSDGYGNVEAPSLVDDYQRARNVIYFSYRGSDEATTYTSVEDSTRTRTGLTRREAYVNAGNQVLRSAQGIAETALRDSRPRKVYQARVLPSGHAVYDTDWKLGTRCRLQFGNDVFNDVLIRGVQGSVTSDQKEEIQGILEIATA